MAAKKAVKQAKQSPEVRLGKMLGGDAWCEEDRFGGGSYIIELDGVRLAEFTIDQMPGCCGCGVISDVDIHSPPKKVRSEKAYYSLLVELMECAVHDEDFTLATATNVYHGPGKLQLIGLKARKWRLANKFRNKKTGNEVFVYTKDLRK